MLLGPESTADHFEDVRSLKLRPEFEDYMGEAFKPLGVYANFFQPGLKGGAARELEVMMVNDEGKAASRFEIGALGAGTYKLTLNVPKEKGECILKATAKTEGGREATVSRRWVRLGE